jgi:hypothetical protein
MPYRTSVVLAIAALALPTVARAQDSTAARDSAAPRDDGPVCLGFAFGAWTPKLDWKAAGHVPVTGHVEGDRTPEGRDWAAPPSEAASDTALVLFPRWWPAGVAVALPTRTPAAGDTITGRAVALVPGPDIQAPVSRVRAWRVPCRRAP